MRYSIRLSYDGSEFSGWQIQNNSISIQEMLQKALSLSLGEDIQVTGAGRTDSGVNAVNYIAHFDTSRINMTDAAGIIYKINAILPKSITVHSIDDVSEDFHARFGARYREYRYFIHRKKDPFCRNYSYYCRYDLDIAKMKEAASLLLGTHDFKCFEKTGGSNMTSTCTVYEAELQTYTPDHVSILGYPAQDGDFLVFRIRADRFLRNMVRAIVGTLIKVGRGKMSVERVAEIIASGSRSDAGESVPGHALFFNKVEY